MPRVPYLPADLREPAEIVDAVRARRGGHLLNLDRMLLHSPALAAGWNTFLGAVRESLVVDRRLRELAMCTVAVLNGAEYEYTQHAPLYIAAGASALAPHLGGLTALQTLK
jgi:alkylhydroperoxidase family enzyme